MSSTSPRNTAERFEFHQPGLGLPDVPRDPFGAGRAVERRFTAVQLVEGFGCGLKGFRRSHQIQIRRVTTRRRRANRR